MRPFTHTRPRGWIHHPPPAGARRGRHRLRRDHRVDRIPGRPAHNRRARVHDTGKGGAGQWRSPTRLVTCGWGPAASPPSPRLGAVPSSRRLTLGCWPGGRASGWLPGTNGTPCRADVCHPRPGSRRPRASRCPCRRRSGQKGRPARCHDDELGLAVHRAATVPTPSNRTACRSEARRAELAHRARSHVPAPLSGRPCRILARRHPLRRPQAVPPQGCTVRDRPTLPALGRSRGPTCLDIAPSPGAMVSGPFPLVRAHDPERTPGHGSIARCAPVVQLRRACGMYSIDIP